MPIILPWKNTDPFVSRHLFVVCLFQGMYAVAVGPCSGARCENRATFWRVRVPAAEKIMSQHYASDSVPSLTESVLLEILYELRREGSSLNSLTKPKVWFFCKLIFNTHSFDFFDLSPSIPFFPSLDAYIYLSFLFLTFFPSLLVRESFEIMKIHLEGKGCDRGYVIFLGERCSIVRSASTSSFQTHIENRAPLEAGKGGAGSVDELGARYPLASRSISVGRVGRCSETPELEVLPLSALQRDAAMRER